MITTLSDDTKCGAKELSKQPNLAINWRLLIKEEFCDTCKGNIFVMFCCSNDVGEATCRVWKLGDGVGTSGSIQ